MTSPATVAQEHDRRQAWWIVWVLTIVGALAVAASLSEALGPDGCGSPFLGRYIGGGGDPAATFSFACLQAAPHKRFLAFVLGGSGLAILVGVLLLSLVVWGRKSLDPRLGVMRPEMTVICAIGAVAASLVLVGGTWAVHRVPSRTSTPPTSPTFP